ncbi:hypothetical protein IFM51744_10645 [Aspergillus udagawae]|nr:hypothetical protein IFM51744_10645 [Aspergillus udagawae]
MEGPRKVTHLGNLASFEPSWSPSVSPAQPGQQSIPTVEAHGFTKICFVQLYIAPAVVFFDKFNALISVVPLIVDSRRMLRPEFLERTIRGREAGGVYLWLGDAMQYPQYPPPALCAMHES